ncbi:MAG: ATP-binding protein [Thermoplasmata archaeon]|nr:MAG: ATP-binding protein [Thermoplasmata archaeon]
MEAKEYLINKKEELKGIKVVPRDLKVRFTKNFIASIIGPRRAGKTFFLYDLIKERKLKESEFCFVNFEEPVEIKDPLKLPFLHQEIYGKEPKFLFFDEIQELRNWEKVIYSLYEKKRYFISITGSSSKLLSKEIVTQLRGRTISYFIYPFSFSEILRVKEVKTEEILSAYKISKIKNLLMNCLNKGCFPDIVLENILPSIFFRDYFTLIIFKDMMERYGIRKRYLLEFFLKSLISSFSKGFSINKIFNTLKSQNVKSSKTTLYNFQKIVEDVGFAFLLKKYEKSLRKIEMSIPKVYIVDNGIASFLEGKVEMGKLMENFVFLELVKRGFEPNREIFYWKDYQQREVDFVLKKGSKAKQLVQVTYASERDEIGNREIKSLLKAGELLKCKNLICITWDYEEEKVTGKRKIRFIPLWKWAIQ